MSGEVEIGDHRGPDIQLRRLVGPKIAAMAARQHGAVARRQLVRLGLTGKQVRYLITAGLLHPVHRSVYALGHPRLTRQGEWMAAVLAGGPGAVLSHQSAAMHWQLVAYYASLPHITTSRKGRRRPGIRHHTASLPADEVTMRDGIPVTTVARTLLDLATCLDRHRLERAIAEAQFRRYADSPSLPVLLERYRGRRGIAVLRASLASNQADLGPTRSGLEETFLRFLDARRLERPELNAPLRLATASSSSTACGDRSGSRSSSTDAPRTCARRVGSRTGCATGACWSPTGSRPGSPRGSFAPTPTASRRTSERWGSATDPPEIEARHLGCRRLTPTEGAR